MRETHVPKASRVDLSDAVTALHERMKELIGNAPLYVGAILRRACTELLLASSDKIFCTSTASTFSVIAMQIHLAKHHERRPKIDQVEYC